MRLDHLLSKENIFLKKILFIFQCVTLFWGYSSVWLERLPCTQEVRSSSLLISTIIFFKILVDSKYKNSTLKNI